MIRPIPIGALVICGWSAFTCVRDHADGYVLRCATTDDEFLSQGYGSFTPMRRLSDYLGVERQERRAA